MPSRKAAGLLNEARETFASIFGTRSDEIYFLGEPSLGFHLGINGLLQDHSTLFYSGTDRAPVHAIVDGRVNQGLAVTTDFTSPSGESDVLVYQSVNPETGIKQRHPDFTGQVFVDNTAYGVHTVLPENWSTAIWQSRSWQGPSGLGIFALRSGQSWRNPLPHNDPTKVPQTFSLPLALASTVALESFMKDEQSSRAKIAHLRSMATQYLQSEIGDVIVVGEKEEVQPSLLSIIVAGVDAERAVNDLSDKGFYVDSGSACMSSNLAPSHVLAAMGLPTTGNIRLTLHPNTTEESVEELLGHLKAVVNNQRNISQ